MMTDLMYLRPEPEGIFAICFVCPFSFTFFVFCFLVSGNRQLFLQVIYLPQNKIVHLMGVCEREGEREAERERASD